jgi:integrase
VGQQSERPSAGALAKRGLPVLTLHGCRHAYASFGIAAGLNAKTLSIYMGHATIAITLNLYGHLMPGAEDEATELLDAFFARHNDRPTKSDQQVRGSRAVVETR